MNKPLLPKVVVDGHVISAADIAAEAQNHPAPQGKPGMAWRAGARALAIRVLLLQEARRRKLFADPQEVSPGRFETEEEALVRMVIDDAISPVPPSDADVERVYLNDPEKFRAPSLYEPAHILFSVGGNQGATRDQAKAKAETTLATLLESPERFAALASELSQCQSAKNGGQLGQISQGDTVPEFDIALQRLEVSEISLEPVETQYGFHIIRLDAKAVGEVLPFQAVKDGISEALEKSAWTKAARAFTASLLAGAKIEGIDFG